MILYYVICVRDSKVFLMLWKCIPICNILLQIDISKGTNISRVNYLFYITELCMIVRNYFSFALVVITVRYKTYTIFFYSFLRF